MLKKALDFASKAHEGQKRKGTTRPYIVHPIEVGEIVQTMTEDEEIICAAILHDTIEDCKDVTWEILSQQFTKRVADMVASESEDKTKSWVERKQSTITHMGECDRAVKMIALADKLSNMRDIDREYPLEGETFWNRFRMKDKQMIGWYYKGIRDVLQEDFKGMEAYEEYCRLIDRNFG